MNSEELRQLAINSEELRQLSNFAPKSWDYLVTLLLGGEMASYISTEVFRRLQIVSGK